MNEQAKNEFLAQLPVFNPADAETYDAACHCGSTQYTVTLSPPLERHPVVSCNCTICTKNGYLLVYPLRERVRFQGNEGSLNSHSFGNKRNLHKFCTTCGSSVFFDPQLNGSRDAPDLLGINVGTKLHILA
jgi:hypothetical protein